MALWEYKVAGLAPENLEKQLNELGADGWELVSITEECSEVWSGGELDHTYTSGYKAILKRSCLGAVTA